MSPKERQAALDKIIDSMGNWSQQGGGAGGNGARNIDAKQMDSFRKKMLDWTSPDQRSDMEAVGKMMEDRRQERGLSSQGAGGRLF